MVSPPAPASDSHQSVKKKVTEGLKFEEAPSRQAGPGPPSIAERLEGSHHSQSPQSRKVL